MKTIQVVVIASLLLILSACAKNIEKQIFDFSVKLVDIPEEGTLHELCLSSEADFDLMGWMIVDSLVIQYQPMADFFFLINSLITGERLMQLCRRGRGPNEMISVVPWFNIWNGYMTIVDIVNTTCYQIDFKKSVECGTTEQFAQSHFNTGVDESLGSLPVYVVGKDSLLTYQIPRDKQQAPYYLLFDLGTGGKIAEYKPFILPRNLKGVGNMELPDLYYATHTIRPDGRKTCMAMRRLPQLNIMDTKTGEVFGIRLRNVPGFQQERSFCFFSSVCSDDQFIYAIYFQKSRDEFERGGSRLLIFDWDGNPVSNIPLEMPVEQVQITNGKLYFSCNYQLNSHLYEFKSKNQSK